MRYPTIIVAKSAEDGGSSSTLSWRGLLHVVFKFKWLILSIFLAVAVGSAVLAVRFTVPQYMTSAQLLIAPGEVRLPTDSGDPARSGASDEQIARTIRLLSGRSLAEDVVHEIRPEVLYRREVADRWHDLSPEVLHRVAATTLAANLEVVSAGKSSIVYVSFFHEDPVLAARVVNLLCELYADRHLRVQNDSKAEGFFEEQLGQVTRKLDESRQALETFRMRNAISRANLDNEREAAAASLASSRAALAEARNQQALLEGRIDVMSRRLAADRRIPAHYYRLKERLALLEAREDELVGSVTGEHPSLRATRDQIAGVRQELAAFARLPYGSSAEQDQFRANTQLEVARLRAEQEVGRARQRELAADVDQRQKRLVELERIGGEFTRLQEQVAAAEETHRRYLARVESARVERAMGEERIVGVRVIEPALPPLSSLDSRLRVKILLGALAGAAAGLGTAFLLHFVLGRVETRDDVERTLGVPLLASVDELKRPTRTGLR